MFKNKKKVLLIGDMPGWAFEQIINFILRNIEGFKFYYDYTIYNPHVNSGVNSDISPNEYNSHSSLKFRKLIPLQGIPLVRALIYYSVRYLNKLGLLSYDEEGRTRKVRNDNKYDLIFFLDYYMDKDADFNHLIYNKKVKGIFTDGFPPKGIKLPVNLDVFEFYNSFLSDADAVLVGSPTIWDIYSKVPQAKIYVANISFDESLFKQVNLKTQSKFIIGWTGNPNRSFKGYYSHIIPVIQKLKELGYNIEFKTQFRGSINSLANFWKVIDLAVIASEADAGPSMFMEASLCGVPSVSTRIGMPNFVIEDGKNGLFCERDIDDILNKIILLIENKELLLLMKSRIREDYIQKLGKNVQVKNWTNLFNSILDK